MPSVSYCPSQISASLVSTRTTWALNKFQQRLHKSTYPVGVTINNKLRWGDHCNITAHKANRTLGIVRRLLKPCEQDVKKRANEALVRRQMEYASSAWSPHTDRDISKLDQVQKNAARFVTGDYRLTTSTTALVKSVGWDPLEKRRLLFQATMLYKIRNKLVNFSIPADIGLQTRSRSSRAHGHAYRQLGINVQSYGYSFFPRVTYCRLKLLPLNLWTSSRVWLPPTLEASKPQAI